METEDIKLYEEQLNAVNQALLNCDDDIQRAELSTLKNSIEELLSLTNEDESSGSGNSNNRIEDEFALFMSEMEKEGAVEKKTQDENSKQLQLKDSNVSIEGMKCRAPHKHQWGDVVYHNAMICSVVSDDRHEEMKVRVLFINPTHQEMLPCPYYYESDCKFSEEQCRFSHGEIVSFSSLQEYVEPQFDLLEIGSNVLAKESDNLWYRAIIKGLFDDKCLVKFECNNKDIEVKLEHVLPLGYGNDDTAKSSEDECGYDREDIINASLMATTSSQALGDWEQHTKGIGSKIMQKMGYIVGTGLGKKAEGRIDPVTAVILPAGKSLDYCMNLREQAGGDKNLFSAERKLKRLQRKQVIQNKKNYEKAQKNRNIFDFMNKKLGNDRKHSEGISGKQEVIRKETSRNLNVQSMELEENIKRIKSDMQKIQTSLQRHKDPTSPTYKLLKEKLSARQNELKQFQSQANVIEREQKLRHNKKLMTNF